MRSKLLLRLPQGTDEAEIVNTLAERRIRVRGVQSYALTHTHAPALVIGYGRLPRAAIDSAVEALRETLASLARNDPR